MLHSTDPKKLNKKAGTSKDAVKLLDSLNVRVMWTSHKDTQVAIPGVGMASQDCCHFIP